MILNGLLAFFLVFSLRLGDVPVGTVRTMLMINGRRGAVFGLAMCESLIWLIAISRVINPETVRDPWRVSGYVLGFATGTIVGMTVERWVGIGTVLIRVISLSHAEEIRQRLLDGNFGVTAIDGRGREGPVMILFVFCPRRRLRGALRVGAELDPRAVVSHDTVTTALGGYHGDTRRPFQPADHK